MYEVSGKLTVILITMWFLQNLGGRLAERKEVAQMFDRERFNLSKLNELEVRKLNQIEITNRFVALENVSGDEDINRAWENMKENIETSDTESLGLQELKKHKPCFDKECSGFFRSKEAGRNTVDTGSKAKQCNNLNNVSREATRRFRNKRNGYLKAKLEELETNSKVKNIKDLYRGISDFKPLNPELNPICYLLALLGAHHFLHVSRIRVKLLTFR